VYQAAPQRPTQLQNANDEPSNCPKAEKWDPSKSCVITVDEELLAPLETLSGTSVFATIQRETCKIETRICDFM
jgi:hypothetical protein